jgi:hypothetical protein
MRPGRVSIHAAAVLLTMATIAGADDAPANRVSVRVYDRAGLDAATIASAVAIAQDALASALIGVDWQHCGFAADDPCALPVTHELVIRIVRTGPAPAQEEHALGDALVDVASGSGVFATIYFNRVHQLSRSAGIADAQVLGYAIAHELGHLLLGSSSHTADGLMRPVWRERELRRLKPADWRFSARDAAALRDRFEAARAANANIVWTTR